MSSVLFYVFNKKHRGYCDSGAEISMVSYNFYSNLPKSKRPKLQPSSIILRGVNGNKLQNMGTIELELDFNGYLVKHTFIVSRDITRNCLIGRDFMINNDVRLYYDLGAMKFGEVSPYIALVRDVHVNSIVRINKSFVIPPQSVMRVYAKSDRGDFGTPAVKVNALTDGFILDEPGITLVPSIMKRKYPKRFPILVWNSTNRHYKVKRNVVVGQITAVDEVHTLPQYLASDPSVYQNEESGISVNNKGISNVNNVNVDSDRNFAPHFGPATDPDCSSAPDVQSPMDSSPPLGQSDPHGSSSPSE